MLPINEQLSQLRVCNDAGKQGDNTNCPSATDAKQELEDFLDMGDLHALIHENAPADKAAEIVTKLRASVANKLMSYSGELDDPRGLCDGVMRAFLKQGSLKDLQANDEAEYKECRPYI